MMSATATVTKCYKRSGEFGVSYQELAMR